LSNFESSCVFIACYDHQLENDVTISEQWADDIADAVIFAHRVSNEQYKTRIPELDGRFGSHWQYSMLDVSHHHFLLSLSQPKPSPTESLKTVADTHASGRNTRSKVKSSSPKDDSWRNPSRQTDPKCRFVLKIVHGETSVANEINASALR
jgi:hypothetical protein